MADLWREIGRVEDARGYQGVIGVEGGTVTIAASPAVVAPTLHLDAAQREEFSRLYFEAERQAEGGDATPASTAHVRFPLEVRYAYPDAGWDVQRAAIAEALTLGEVYTIRKLTVGQSSSCFELHGIAGEFNTVFFAPVWTDDDD